MLCEFCSIQSVSLTEVSVCQCNHLNSLEECSSFCSKVFCSLCPLPVCREHFSGLKVDLWLSHCIRSRFYQHPFKSYKIYMLNYHCYTHAQWIYSSEYPSPLSDIIACIDYRPIEAMYCMIFLNVLHHQIICKCMLSTVNFLEHFFLLLSVEHFL